MTTAESNSIDHGSSNELRKSNGMIFRTESPHASTGQELLRADAGDIAAVQVSMDHSGAETIKADRVSMDHSVAKELNARTAQLDRSGVMSLTADQIVMQQSSGMLMTARTSRIVNSKVLFLASDSAELDANTRVLVHFGSAAEGARWQSRFAAATVGGLLVLAMVLGSRLGRHLFGRKVEGN